MVGATAQGDGMIQWDDVHVYAHRQPVDFPEPINGLSVLIQESMALDVFSSAPFVFGCRGETKSKFCTGIKRDFAFGTSDWKKTNSNSHATVMKCYH